MEQSERLAQMVEAARNGDNSQLVHQLQLLAQAEIPERPALAANVELAGEMQESGFVERQWLIQRNGQFIQVTELLYKVAELCNGERSLEEIAAAMTESTLWVVTGEHVRLLVKKLIPLGVIAPAGGAVVQPKEAPSALRVNMRAKVIGPRVINPIAEVLKVLYTPVIFIPMLLAVVLAHGWLYFQHGSRLVEGFLSALYQPWQFFVILGLMVLAGIFHELGHAAALRYGGGHVREAGIGFYLIYPVLYTDTTDSYRLGRWARVRTDLGGFYFYLIFATIMMGVSLLTGQAFLLLTVVLINIDILYQLLPFVRFDGYWTLADLTGIPDLLSQIKPFVASILPVPGWKGDRLPDLKPLVKAVFIAYIVLTLPVLMLLFFFMILRLPRFLSVTWAAYIHHVRVITAAWSSGNYLAIVALAVQMLLLALPIAGVLYILYAFSRPLVKGLWHWSRPTLPRRLAGATLALGAVALLAYLWLPKFSFINVTIPDGVQRVEVTEREHVEVPVAYPQTPPVGGNHAPIWQNCGFYDSPIRDENAVHSLEHGAVWITYRPDLPQEQVQTLRQLASQTYVLVSPYPDQPEPLVASAWGYQLALPSVEDERLGQFVNAFRLASSAPEWGEACTGGVGVPR